MPLFTEIDTEKLGSKMLNDSAAGILVIEQLWTKGFKKDLLNANAELIDEGRIRPEKITAAAEDLETSKV